jgi:hypothetical protein
MNAQQILLPFRGKKTPQPSIPNVDLIGRWYDDRRGRVTVVGLQAEKDGYLILRRDRNGSIFSMPVWLVRLIFMEKRRKRAA